MLMVRVHLVLKHALQSPSCCRRRFHVVDIFQEDGPQAAYLAPSCVGGSLSSGDCFGGGTI
jgi:hypothetical protein